MNILVDQADIDLYSFTWVPDAKDYLYVFLNGRRVYLHRWVAARMRGVDELDRHVRVGHKNRLRWDNRRSNVLIRTYADQNQMSSVKRGKTSVYRGVHWSSARHCYQAHVYVYDRDGKRRKEYIGGYASEVDAALAYDRRMLQVYDHPILNFPDRVSSSQVGMGEK